MKTIQTARLDSFIPGELFDEVNRWCNEHDVPLFMVIAISTVDDSGANLVVDTYDLDDDGEYYILQNGAIATNRISVRSKWPFPMKVFEFV